MRYLTLASFVVVGVLVAAIHAADEPAKEKAATKAVSDLIVPPTKVAELQAKHFVTSWLLLGPFPFGENDFGAEDQQDSVDKEFMLKEAELDGSQKAPAGTKWQLNKFEEGGIVDLDAFYSGPDHVAAYAVAWINCPEEIKAAKLLVGSDDYIKVWINGKLVHTYKKERRAVAPDQDKVSGITLQKGSNRIVVKCVDVVLGWGFCLRFADNEGKAFEVRPGK